jgi:TRAP-type transport system periplasmic protein
MTGTRHPLWTLAALLMALGLVAAACNGEDEPDEDDAAVDEDADPDEVDAAAAEGPDVTLVLGHPFPAEHPMAVNMIAPWIEEVEERTGGTVTFDVQPGGAITDADAAYENAAAGVIDMGWALHGYTPGRFPITQIIELPFEFESAEQATEVLWDLYEEFPALQEEMDDVELLALWTHDIGDLFTVDQPVESMDDMEGLTLRAPGPLSNTLIDSLGGDPVGMPAGELYDALERGVIDGLMIANSGISSFSLDEVVNYATLGNFYVASQFVAMNPGSWEQLSPEQQQVIEDTSGRELSLTGARAYDEIFEDLQASYEDMGIEVTELDEDELDDWRAATEEVPQQWIDDAEDEGAPGQEMYDRLQELVGE